MVSTTTSISQSFTKLQQKTNDADARNERELTTTITYSHYAGTVSHDNRKSTKEAKM